MTARAEIVLAPLTAAAFAPFGDVIAATDAGTQRPFDLTRQDSGAQPALFSITVAPPAGPPAVTKFERHPATIQMLQPGSCSRWYVVAAPDDAAGAPDLTRAVAFLADHETGVVLKPRVWHAPLLVGGAPATFLVLMWRGGQAPDVEYHALDRPIALVPAAGS